MLMSNFCDYSDGYILVKGTTKNIGTRADAVARQADEIYKQAIPINSASFTDCISEINKTQVDDTKNLDAVVLMYNLVEYSNDYSKTSRGLWQYCRD